jgi:Protein of unknown function (DUF3558)
VTEQCRGLRPLVVAVALAGLVACGNQSAGTPVATEPSGSTRSPTSSPTSRPPSSTSESVGSGLAALDPCELLTSADRAQLQLPGGEPDSTAGNPGCDWNRGASGGLVSVTIREDRGINQLNPGDAINVEDVAIGAHQGRRLEFPEGNCSFDIAITDASSVTVSALIVERLTEACVLAQRAVILIEPKLPRE